MVGEKRKVAVTRVAASTRKVIAPDVISTCSSTPHIVGHNSNISTYLL